MCSSKPLGWMLSPLLQRKTRLCNHLQRISLECYIPWNTRQEYHFWVVIWHKSNKYSWPYRRDLAMFLMRLWTKGTYYLCLWIMQLKWGESEKGRKRTKKWRLFAEAAERAIYWRSRAAHNMHAPRKVDKFPDEDDLNLKTNRRINPHALREKGARAAWSAAAPRTESTRSVGLRVP